LRLPFVQRFPDGPDSDICARLTVTPKLDAEPRSDIAALDAAIFARRTNRRAFYQDPVSADVVDMLTRSAAAEGAVLLEVRTDDHRTAVAQLAQRADGVQNADRAHRAELSPGSDSRRVH
jgi:hypothetical protein